MRRFNHKAWILVKLGSSDRSPVVNYCPMHTVSAQPPVDIGADWDRYHRSLAALLAEHGFGQGTMCLLKLNQTAAQLSGQVVDILYSTARDGKTLPDVTQEKSNCPFHGQPHELPHAEADDNAIVGRSEDEFVVGQSTLTQILQEGRSC